MEDRSSFIILSVVAIVAIVALVTLISGNETRVIPMTEDITG